MNQVGREEFVREFGAWVKELNPDIDPSELRADENLFDAGVLDSFSVLRVIMFVEQLRGAEVDLEEANIESFSSLDRIYETFIAV